MGLAFEGLSHTDELIISFHNFELPQTVTMAQCLSMARQGLSQ